MAVIVSAGKTVIANHVHSFKLTSSLLEEYTHFFKQRGNETVEIQLNCEGCKERIDFILQLSDEKEAGTIYSITENN